MKAFFILLYPTAKNITNNLCIYFFGALFSFNGWTDFYNITGADSKKKKKLPM